MQAITPMRQSVTRVSDARRSQRGIALRATPSSRTGGSELELLSRYTEVVPDTFLGQAGTARRTAETVSFGLLHGIVSAESLGLKPYENAIAAAAGWDRCTQLQMQGDDRLNCQLDRALVNVGELFAKEVDGRVCMEVDPRLDNTAAMVRKAEALMALFSAEGVPASRLLFQLPGTWAGIQAAKQLEAEGIPCQVVLVYSLVQGAAAAQAGASLVTVSVGRLREWFDKNPGVIRDPQGPRQDAGLGGSTDPALKLAKDLWMYCRKYHPKTKVIASGIRTRDDALALAGIDYLVLGPKVMASLSQSATTAGYNDGLSAAQEDTGLAPDLTDAAAAAGAPAKMAPITSSSFAEGLGMAGRDLLSAGLKTMCADVERMRPYFSKATLGVGA